jgi:hypothetical protein
MEEEISTPRSRCWSDMVEEEELSSLETSSHHFYSDEVQDGSPNLVSAASPVEKQERCSVVAARTPIV